LQDLEEAKKTLMAYKSPRSHSLDSPDPLKTDDGKIASNLNSPLFRVIDKTDILDNDKFRKLSHYHNDQ
jgi:hypothetical protein